MKRLALIALGLADNLFGRGADVMLKEMRRLALWRAKRRSTWRTCAT